MSEENYWNTGLKYGTSYQPNVGFMLPNYGLDTKAAPNYYSLDSKATSFNGDSFVMPAISATGTSPTKFLDNPLKWGEENGMFSTRDKQGWGGMALSGAQSLMNLVMGMKQYGLMKDQFEFQKNAWNKEFEVNKNLTNSRLEDRQNRRNAEGSAIAQDTASYMAKYGVK